MARAYGLRPDEAAALRRLPPGARLRVARDVAPNAEDFSRAFRWGAEPHRAQVVAADVPPARLRVAFELQAVEYLAAKGKSSRTRAAGYRHEFDPPYPVVATSAPPVRVAGRGRTIGSRGAPRPVRDVTELGKLLALEGTTLDGKRVRLEPKGVALAADPVTRGLFLIRTPEARARGVPPRFIVRGASRYSVRAEGIVG